MKGWLDHLVSHPDAPVSLHFHRARVFWNDLLERHTAHTSSKETSKRKNYRRRYETDA